MVKLEQAINAARQEFGWGSDFRPFLRFTGDKIVKWSETDADVTQEELRWMEDYALQNGGWDKTDDLEPFALDLTGKTVREVMTDRDNPSESLMDAVFQSFRDSENPQTEISLSFISPIGDEDNVENSEACLVEVTLWEKDIDNPGEGVAIAEIRLGPYPLDTLAEPLAEEARANIPIAKAQLKVLPDHALSMYRSLKRAAKTLTDALRYVEEGLEKHADRDALTNARTRAAEAAREALLQNISKYHEKRRKQKEGEATTD